MLGLLSGGYPDELDFALSALRCKEVLDLLQDRFPVGTIIENYKSSIFTLLLYHRHSI